MAIEGKEGRRGKRVGGTGPGVLHGAVLLAEEVGTNKELPRCPSPR